MNGLLLLTTVLLLFFCSWLLIKYLKSDSRQLFIASQKREWYSYQTVDNEIVFTWQGRFFTARPQPLQVHDDHLVTTYFITPFDYEKLTGLDTADVRIMTDLLEESYPHCHFRWADPLATLLIAF
ncbi:hypothetical protein [Brochothrix campestris]|uniref:Sigma-w pathway protein ysdB n=1 Tax=Brochothrix campestris FSL F6-1037 TaxID=1265861 RepID=W7CQ66_9LIST|nr:hypothetical protein [Brochothrix campestris]EUJ39237.1 hypothetical protein BCAMP_07565 [Brochothrix campestris FSL F6-1037]